MGDLTQIAGVGSAFVAGLVTSLHCAGMCGPLGCLLAPRAGEANYMATSAVYQLCRVLSYTVLGALAGLLGLTALDWVEGWGQPVVRFFPWALAVFFLLLALRVDQWLPKPTGPARWLHRQTGRLARLPRPLAGALLGTFTPLLPCGPLYLVLWLALMTQSPLRGAEFLLAFGLGTLPLLWLVQAGFVRVQGWLNPARIALLQRSVAGLAAAVLIWRVYHFETSEGLFCGM